MFSIKSKLSICVIFIALTNNIIAQITPAPSQWASSVLSFQFGNTQNNQASFPLNVLGPVTANATPENPAFLPKDIVSIGAGGFVALGFNPAILNGPGYDFIVWENVLKANNNVFFREYLTVSVSVDGNTWYDIPSNTTTLRGIAGVNTTKPNASNYRDTSSCGGDPFDLSDVGLDSVKFVKITDATKTLQNCAGNNCAAELDAVGAVWQKGLNDPPAVLAINNIVLFGKRENNKNRLLWNVTTDNMLNKYEIQRSNDAATFITIGIAKINGNNATFIDEALVENNNYYRLKIIDEQGKFDYSNIIFIQNSIAKIAIKIYPNPVTNIINIQNTISSKNITSLQIYDASMRQVSTKNLNQISLSSSITINVKTLQPGLYFIKCLLDDGTTITTKILKQ